MDWSIQQVARLAGTTSRTLRHYDDIGLLAPSRIGGNGYRYYDEGSLVRLQRILMLRGLGLGIPAIADVLEGQRDDLLALTGHLTWLRQEQQRLDRQIASVQATIGTMEEGKQLMADTMFDGFEHTQFREEVVERWGAAAWAASDSWWTSMTATEKAEWRGRQQQLIDDWVAALGSAPDGAAAQALAARQAEWLGAIPGTPRADGRPTREYFVGLGDMYVADERFAAHYGGVLGASFVRDAMRIYAEKHL